MTRRENFDRTVAHTNPDHVIIDFGGCPFSSPIGDGHARLLKYLGISPDPDAPLSAGIDERILEKFDIDVRYVGCFPSPVSSLSCKISETEEIDAWGIRRVFTGLYWDIVDSPLNDAPIEALDDYPWPQPSSIDTAEIDACVRRAKHYHENTDYVICCGHPVLGVFELGCWICGFDDFLYRCAAEPEFVFKLFNKFWEYQKGVTEIYFRELGKYIHYTTSGDDFATQRGTFTSPQMFRDYVQPYFTKRISYAKQFTTAYHLHHSCGSIYSILDDIINCGVEIINPIQPLATDMEPEKLYERFGGRIVFHGGIDTQNLMPYGTKEDIYREVQRVVGTLHHGGGYMLAAAHNLQPDVPTKNIVHMLEAARKYCY